MSSRYYDMVTCRFEPVGDDWFEVYACAGPNYPLYEDEKYVAECPKTYLKSEGIQVDEDGLAAVTLSQLRSMETETEHGWDDDE